MPLVLKSPRKTCAFSVLQRSLLGHAVHAGAKVGPGAFKVQLISVVMTTHISGD